jgi:hypothetical protein
MRWMLLSWAGMALGAVGCASLPQPTPEDVSRALGPYPGTTLGSLTEARKTYVKTCSGCHALHLPTEFPARRWPSLVNEMVTVQKVKLSAAQRQEIEEFVIVMSETRPTASR